LFAAVIRLILFDIDGTLVRTGGAGVRAFAKVFQTEFGSLEHFERLKFAGRTDISLVREFFDAHGIASSPEHFSRFFEHYVHWLDRIVSESGASVCAGVREFLRAISELPQPPVPGLLTGNIRLGAEIKLRRAGLWNEFVTGAFADDAEDRDQIAAIARERGERLLGGRLAADEVLVVGDTPLDIRCGRSIGAKVLAVATGGAKLEELQAHRPDWAVEDLTRVSAATLCT
jgi:phosphoglycolate phosphatase